MDKALVNDELTDEVMADARFPGSDDEPPVQRRDRKYEQEKMKAAIEDEFEKSAEQTRDEERFESDCIALAERGWK